MSYFTSKDIFTNFGTKFPKRRSRHIKSQMKYFASRKFVSGAKGRLKRMGYR